MSAPAVIAGFLPNPKQLEAAKACLDSKARVVVLDGAIRSGKTQAAARLLVEMAVEKPATYLVGRATYRSLRDSTMKAMVYGDGALPPLIPPELVKEVRLSDELVRLHSGAEILFRSLEENAVGKILNLSLGGILVDQIEELDGGPEGERMFDTLLGRLSDPRGARKLLAVANPAGLTSWQYRRLIHKGSRDRGVRRVHFTLRDNAANLPADYVSDMEATRLTRPHWYRSFILGEWGAFEGQAFAEFDEAVHVVDPFDVPPEWTRWESLDHGINHETAWLAWAANEDGDFVIYDEYHQPGLVSKHAAEILARRRRWYGNADPDVVGGRIDEPRSDEDAQDVRDGWKPWGVDGDRDPAEQLRVVCWADPSIRNRTGGETRWGDPSSVRTEYLEHGLHFALGNNDRAAGYARLLELLHVEAGRIAPGWAGVPDSLGGAPRLYIVGKRCPNLVEQLKSAPIAADGVGAGEMIDGKWESAHGHSCASARYGALSRPQLPKRSELEEPDPRKRRLREMLSGRAKARESGAFWRGQEPEYLEL